MSARGSKEVRLVLGASPRVDLLPPEVADRKKGAALRRAIVIGVIGAVVVSGGGYALASWQSIQAASRLGAAQAETSNLIAKQAEFNEVRSLATQLDTVAAARQAGALTEIDWSLFYADVTATLPAGSTIDTFVVTANSPISEVPVSPYLTHGAHAAEVTLLVSTPNLESVAQWLANLKNLTGYADATVSPSTKSPAGYASTVALNVTDARYTKRFAPPETPVAETTDAATATTEGEGAE